MYNNENEVQIKAFNVGHPGGTISVAQSSAVEGLDRYERLLRVGRKSNSGTTKQSPVEPYYLRFNKPNKR